MPAVQRNFNYAAYESDDATTYCLKADQDWITNSAVSGAAACAGAPAYGRATTRRSPRKFIYRDPTTFRTVTEPVFTAAAYAAAAIGSTIAIDVPGETATVNYGLVKKVPEKIPSTVVGRQAGDHA
jgi:hypothetical protein